MAIDALDVDNLVEGESVVYTSPNTPSTPADLRILHFNDVYHVSPGSRDPVGGVARFKTVCGQYTGASPGPSRLTRGPKPLTLFSGDAFNPSVESAITKGKHMVPALNTLGLDAACLGNHDLDFGVPQFKYLASLCTFPWLCANVFDPAEGPGVPLGRCRESVILEAEGGVRVGVIGLVEREWLDTINSLPPGLVYQSASATARRIAPKLRAQGADLIICVTHQREPNDVKLAQLLEPGTVDIVLGGHDHFYGCRVVNETLLLRSGTDFRQLSHVEAWKPADSSQRWTFRVSRREILKSIPEDSKAAAMVEQMAVALAPKLDKAIGYTRAPLDARFTTVRRRESNLANFICDLMRLHYSTDCAIMAAGTVRGDQIYPPGVLRVRDLMDCFPFEDPCVVVRLKGRDLVAALENGVSKFPALEGRFPHVSGIYFAFDPEKPSGQRCSGITIAGEDVDLEREYILATRDYMVRGKDGFTSLMLEEEGGPAVSVVGEESGIILSLLLRQYFMSLTVLGQWKNWSLGQARHWAAVHQDLHGVHPVATPSVELTQDKAFERLVLSVKGVESPRVPEGVDQGAEGDQGVVKTVNGDHGVIEPTISVPSLFGPDSPNGSDTDQGDSNPQTPPDHSMENGSLHHKDRSEALSTLHFSDSEEDVSLRPPVEPESPQRQRELHLMRKVTRKWWRLANMSGHPDLCEVEGDEFGVHWTQGIAPIVEGRIVMIGGVVEAGLRP